MTDKHTPGPWRNLGVKNMMVDGRCHRIVSDESYPAAFVPAWDRPNPGQECGKAEAEANARLIAAAPDLLAALDDIVNGENWRSGRKFDPNSGDFDLSIQRAAIAKARGQV